jgi:hypothetical protein
LGKNVRGCQALSTRHCNMAPWQKWSRLGWVQVVWMVWGVPGEWLMTNLPLHSSKGLWSFGVFVMGWEPLTRAGEKIMECCMGSCNVEVSQLAAMPLCDCPIVTAVAWMFSDSAGGRRLAGTPCSSV